MGSEVAMIEERVEEFNDVENTIFVAVGKNVKESTSLILWALQCFAGMKICLLINLLTFTLLEDKFSASRVKDQVVKACRELDRQKMHKILNQYNLTLDQAGTGKVWIEAGNVETGIVQILVQHGIRWLVMGAAADKLYSKYMSELKSNKAIYVYQQAPISCQIWFACNGHLIYTRKSSAGARLHARSIEALPSSPAAGETMLTLYHEADASMKVSSLQCLENATSTKNGTSDSTPLLVLPTARDTASTPYLAIDGDEEANSARYLENSMVSTKNVCSTSTSTGFLINYARGNGSTLPAPLESEDQLEGPQGLLSSDLLDKLEYATPEAENSKQKAFEESIRRWKAEEDAKEALHKAEASENLYMEEITQRKEMEATLAKQNQEVEITNNQRDQFKKELQMVRDQKPGLVDRISKACDAEKELEEKIIQAVNLLITFKERRDNLQDELDNAKTQINRLTNYDETTNLSQPQFYKPSFWKSWRLLRISINH